jgi:hypothetical protein
MGAVLVFVCFPTRDRERELLAQFAAEDAEEPSPTDSSQLHRQPGIIPTG